MDTTCIVIGERGRGIGCEKGVLSNPRIRGKHCFKKVRKLVSGFFSFLFLFVVVVIFTLNQTTLPPPHLTATIAPPSPHFVSIEIGLSPG